MISEATSTDKQAVDGYRKAYSALQSDALDSQTPSWLSRLRANAMEQFKELGFPTVANEDWKYTNVAPLTRIDFWPSLNHEPSIDTVRFSESVYAEAAESRLVFVDGIFNSTLSVTRRVPEGVIAVDLITALNSESLGGLVREHLGRVVEYNENGFTALNTALINGGAVLVIPKGVSVPAPIHLAFVSSSKANAASFPRVLIVAEELSSATLIESYSGRGDQPYFTNAVVEVVLNDGARIEHYRVQDESPAAFHVTTTRATLARDSRFDTTAITLGGKLSRHNVDVIMEAEGASCSVDGLYIIDESQHTDTHSLIDHQRPHCTSRQLYKGILDGKSRAVFNGKVFVRHGALGTDAQQTNKNLLLSKEAHVDTKPQLEIFADDVKCAHGAAIGQLDEEELFYLESRGIHPDLARNLLTYGFAEEVIAKIKIESIKAQLDEAVLNRLHARLEA